jgi:hypothetical protein
MQQITATKMSLRLADVRQILPLHHLVLVQPELPVDNVPTVENLQGGENQQVHNKQAFDNQKKCKLYYASYTYKVKNCHIVVSQFFFTLKSLKFPVYRM